MSRESHQRYLERAALREAQRAFLRSEQPANVRDFLALRVQTVEPWKRLSCVLIGCGFAGFAAWLAASDATSIWATGFISGLSLGCFVVGIVGWKRLVESVLEGAAEALFNRLIDAL